MLPFVTELTDELSSRGFRPVADTQRAIPDSLVLLKRQTFVSNRAVIVVALPEVPKDFAQYLASLRKQIAFRCGFFPFFYGIGIQVVLVAPGITHSDLKPSEHIARIDNQWAIVQSLFFVDTQSQQFIASHTWAQFVTGKFQDIIAETLAKHYSPIAPDQMK